MNQEKYDSLSDAEKGQLNSVFGENLSKVLSANWDLGDEQGATVTKASGKSILEYSNVDKAILDKAFGKVTQDVFAETKAKGINGAEVFSYIKEQVSSYSKSK